MSELSYSQRLQELKLPNLAYRRVRGDMTDLFKILTCKYDLEVSDFIQLQEKHQPENTITKYAKSAQDST